MTRPLEARFPPNRPDHALAMAAHDQAVAEGRATYVDPRTGLWVMTAAALAARGHCCASGCRHCPYAASGSA